MLDTTDLCPLSGHPEVCNTLGLHTCFKSGLLGQQDIINLSCRGQTSEANLVKHLLTCLVHDDTESKAYSNLQRCLHMKNKLSALHAFLVSVVSPDMNLKD